MRKIVFIILILGSFSTKVEAQFVEYDKQEDPPFITLINVGLGTTSFELGLTGRINEKLATGFFAMGFHNRNLTGIESNYMIGARVKRYVFDIRPEPYIGAIVGAHGFETRVHPLAGINIGFDIYAGGNINEDKILTKMGLDFGAGVDASGKSFFGVTVSFGLGFIENKSKPYSYH